MNITLNLKKGLDLHLAGAPTGTPARAETVKPHLVGVVPDDFPGLALKPVVKEGDAVAKGSAILRDKQHPDVAVTSPVAGVIKEIVRGERRKLERIVITPNDSADAVKFDTSATDAATVRKLLQESGLWVMMRQRPYAIVALPDSTPRDIFVSSLDTAPLAPDLGQILAPHADELKAGVALLSKLTQGTIYIGRRNGSPIADVPGATMVDITGPHPSGNAGVIAANIKSVNKGETIWTLDGITLARIGHLALNGTLDTDCCIALDGSEVEKPEYINTVEGADIESIITGRLIKTEHHRRIISGNPLSGVAVKADGFLRYPYTQVTVIPEGDDVVEFMGWASISPKKMSTSRSFPGHFLFKKLFKPDARLLGGRRAMIMSGEYDKVVPMDIMTEYLIKAILSKNIEEMEALGIYEVAPEDFAVAEYVCTSKLPLQSIVAQGLDYLRKELE